MDQATIEALRDSIAHWDRLATGTAAPGEDIGYKHCALCAAFYPTMGRSATQNGCGACPVKQRTGKDCCNDSPYEEAEDAFSRAQERTDPDSDPRRDPDFKDAALVELEFLRSLLPFTPIITTIPTPSYASLQSSLGL